MKKQQDIFSTYMYNYIQIYNITKLFVFLCKTVVLFNTKMKRLS